MHDTLPVEIRCLVSCDHHVTIIWPSWIRYLVSCNYQAEIHVQSTVNLLCCQDVTYCISHDNHMTQVTWSSQGHMAQSVSHTVITHSNAGTSTTSCPCRAKHVWLVPQPGLTITISTVTANKTLILLRRAPTAGLKICLTNVHTYCEIECFIELAYPTGERGDRKSVV